MMYRGGLSAGRKPTCRHSRNSRSFHNFPHRVRVYVHTSSHEMAPQRAAAYAPAPRAIHLQSLSLDMLPGSSGGCRLEE